MRDLNDPACPFCQRILSKNYMRTNGLVVVFEPLHPVTPGHLLAVPVIHVEHALADPSVAGITMAYAAEVAAETGAAYNLITSAGHRASQTVFHLHVHLVPRTLGDGLVLPWTARQARQPRDPA